MEQKLLSRIEVRGVLASTPIVLTLFYKLADLGVGYYVYLLALTLILLGLYFNRYTFMLCVVLLSYLTVLSPHIGVLGLIAWLVGITWSRTTSLVDVVVAFTVIVASLGIVANWGLLELALTTPLAVHVLDLAGLGLAKSSNMLGLALLLVAGTIVLAKATGSSILLDLYASSIIASIVVLERIARYITTVEES